VALATFTLAGFTALALSRTAQLRDRHRLVELGDRAEHLPDQGRRGDFPHIRPKSPEASFKLRARTSSGCLSLSVRRGGQIRSNDAEEANFAGETRSHSNVDTVSTVSRVSDNGDEAGPNHPSSGLEQAL